MPTGRPEPFQVALSALRQGLRDGAFRPGDRIAASELGDALRLSATPVREALSRLVGEGVLEDRRGQGFFVRSVSGADLADLYRMSLALLVIGQDPHRKSLRRSPEVVTSGATLDDPVREVERLFSDWMVEAGGQCLYGAHRSIQVQLAPFRRAEPQLFADLEREASELVALSGADARALRAPSLRRFHARRIAVADRLATLAHRRIEASEL